MPKPPKFTPHTWQDQQRLLAEGERAQQGRNDLVFILKALGLVAFLVVWVCVTLYGIASIFF